MEVPTVTGGAYAAERVGQERRALHLSPERQLFGAGAMTAPGAILP